LAYINPIPLGFWPRFLQEKKSCFPSVLNKFLKEFKCQKELIFIVLGFWKIKEN